MGLMEFLKGLFKKKEDDVTYKVGDIVWAKRYQTEEEKKKIRYGHQEGPYVIIKIKRGKIFALQETSNPHQEIRWNKVFYQLGRLNYDMKKNSYINCSKVFELKDNQIIREFGKLTDYDLNQIKKYLYLVLKSDYRIKPDIEKKYLDFKISIGDIISYKDNKYYIYGISESYYLVHRIRNKVKNHKSILLNNTYYSFIFELEGKIKINKRIELIDTFNTGEIEIINKNKSSYMEELIDKRNNGKKLTKGTVIDYKKCMYYIYEEDEEKVYVYRIYTNDCKDKGLASIKIANGTYKTFFNMAIIPKSNLSMNGYRIRRHATKEEIDYNAKLFKLPKKVRGKKKIKVTQEKKTYDLDDFIPMVILQHKNNKKYYLILSRENNIVELVNINDMSDCYLFELEKKTCPFVYYRIVSKEEFDMYINKVNEFKDMVAMFDK